MSGMSFQFDLKALVIVVAAAALFYLLGRWKRNFITPCFYFPDVNSLVAGTGRSKWTQVPNTLFYLALLMFACAFIDPRFYTEAMRAEGQGAERRLPVEGIAIYFVLDQSGSMVEEVYAGGGRRVRKIDLLKDLTKKFIEGDSTLGLRGRPNDMIGLVFFARAARVQAPLTLDHTAILQQLSHFSQVPERDQDGTSIGYAIFKTANMIAATRHYAQELSKEGKPAYTIKNSVMILVTDGLQDPNPLDKGKRLRNMDVPEAAAYAKEQGIHLYIVNVEPKLSTEEFAPYRHIMQRAAAVTGGKFYMVDNRANLGEIYQEIDRLEKSVLPEEARPGADKDLRPDLYRRISLFVYFLFAGIITLLAALVLDITILRRVP